MMLDAKQVLRLQFLVRVVRKEYQYSGSQFSDSKLR